MKLQQLTHSPVQSAPALLAKFISHLQEIITWPQSTRSFSFPVPYKTDREDLLGRHQSEQQSLSNSRLGGTLSLISMLTWNCVGPLQKAKHAILLREAGSLNPTGGSPWPDKRTQTVKYLCPILWALHKTTWAVLQMSMGLLRTRHPWKVFPRAGLSPSQTEAIPLL